MHTLITTREGKMCSFGHGKHGKLGDGDEVDASTPSNVRFYNTTVNISRVCAGYNISLALDNESQGIFSFGSNGKDMLGYRTGSIQRVPRIIPYLKFDIGRTDIMKFIERGESAARSSFPTRVKSVTIGAINTMVLTDSGELFLFGIDEYGQSGRTLEQK